MRIFEAGDGRVPNVEIKGQVQNVTLVADQDGSLNIVDVVEDLKKFRDGRIFVISEQDFSDRFVECPLDSLLSPGISGTLFVVGKDVGTRPLPISWIRYLFSVNLSQVLALDGLRSVQRYQRPQDTTADARNVLFVSPGSIFPLSMGSHQRMFDSLAALAEEGCNVDVIFPRRPEARQVAAEAALSLVSRTVTGYKPSKGKLKKGVGKRRLILEKAAKLTKVKISDKPTFPELTQIRSSFWLRKCLEEKLSERRYDAIWVNYAWMMGQMTQKIRNAVPCIICDTHDVQFYRNSQNRNSLEELLFSDKYVRAQELRQLEKADHVLAISDRDAELLKKNMTTEKVKLALPSFTYYLADVSPCDPRRPLRFGFIGTRMDANRDALKMALLDWWPVIHAHSPASRFQVAGSICLDPEVRSLALMDDRVDLLGFVDDLKGFYGDLDVLLSPVLVKGGLNFKNVETIVSGKHVFTTQAGAEALAPLEPQVVDRPEDLPGLLRVIEDDPEGDVARRLRLQAQALHHFTRIDIPPLLTPVRKVGGRIPPTGKSGGPDQPPRAGQDDAQEAGA